MGGYGASLKSIMYISIGMSLAALMIPLGSSDGAEDSEYIPRSWRIKKEHALGLLSNTTKIHDTI